MGSDRLKIATQYEIPFKLSISTFHVSVMAITPAIASHKVRHPSPSNFSVFMAPRQKVSCRDPEWGWGARGFRATELKLKCRRVNVVPKLGNASRTYAQVFLCAI